jgi:hypothetical protein
LVLQSGLVATSSPYAAEFPFEEDVTEKCFVVAQQTSFFDSIFQPVLAAGMVMK